ncbi:MAG: SDR family NAD(P)-dependent oxidoreductase, partial [Bacteroidia bacterium]|nr:SDR family NAD(P)-dependent oxidoreductase [Bacteroidia bacterium]
MQKNIIVTGGAQGIGKITTLELLKNGYTVSVFDTDRVAMDEFKTEADTENIA